MHDSMRPASPAKAGSHEEQNITKSRNPTKSGIRPPPLHRQPSVMTSKSPAVRLRNAGFSSSLFQRASMAPLTYMSLPLSATMSPWSAWRGRCCWTLPG